MHVGHMWLGHYVTRCRAPLGSGPFSTLSPIWLSVRNRDVVHTQKWCVAHNPTGPCKIIGGLLEKWCVEERAQTN